MIRHLTRLGDSLAIVIEPAILELLGIDEQTPLEVRTDGVGFRILPLKTTEGAVAPAAGSWAAQTPSLPSRLPASDVATAPPETRGHGLGGAEPPPPSETVDLTRPDARSAPAEKSASLPSVRVVLNGEVILRQVFSVDELLIGRNRQAEIHLDDRALSRDHAKLSRRGASFWIADLGSANGTFVGAERITEPRLLRAGDIVRVGRYELRIDGVEEAPGDTPVLTITGPDGQHRFAMVDNDIVIGRGDDCDVAINNRSVSRRHLHICRGSSPGTFVATNVSGHNVVKVAGLPISDPTPFGLDDVIEIGEFSIAVGLLDEDGSARRTTMVIDRSTVARTAYVDGDYGAANAGASPASRRR